MLTKIYFTVWFLVLLTLGAFFVTGSCTQFVMVVFGFIAFGMTFMGMISVLPTAVHEAITKH
ncbi:MAG TPA: hypothetical protein DEA22_11740 [Blastocatellia bacterium]|nr:hypothetical protein [Blastocatellia bacterium]